MDFKIMNIDCDIKTRLFLFSVFSIVFSVVFSGSI